MLSFKEKLAIINEFPELTRHDVSMGRVNFQFEESKFEKKNVVYHLHPNGNGFVYVGLIPGYESDAKGMVNIRNSSADALRSVIRKSIDSLSTVPVYEDEEWINENNVILTLKEEAGGWDVYADDILDGAFATYESAVNYLEMEGFRRK